MQHDLFNLNSDIVGKLVGFALAKYPAQLLGGKLCRQPIVTVMQATDLRDQNNWTRNISIRRLRKGCTFVQSKMRTALVVIGDIGSKDRA